jgi:hypothetical protein
MVAEEVADDRDQNPDTWGRYTITATSFLPDGSTFDSVNYLALQIWVWPNGYQQRVTKHWSPAIPIEEA